MTVTETAPAVQSALPADELTAPGAEAAPIGTSPLIEDELLVEEISIDGMCGVY